jgi:hypothetical protein
MALHRAHAASNLGRDLFPVSDIVLGKAPLLATA